MWMTFYTHLDVQVFLENPFSAVEDTAQVVGLHPTLRRGRLRAVALTVLSTHPQVATRRAGAASARGPLLACSAGRRRTSCSRSSPPKELRTASACRGATLASTGTAQESAGVSRGGGGWSKRGHGAALALRC